jgi:nitrite reductase/ring-hydroxylating ferredoxin subunit
MAQAVGKVSDVPAGGVALFQVEGRPIAVANVDGRLFAFDDLCTHRGCSLTPGRLDGTSIICPCHASVFQVTDGSVTAGPATRPLRTYEVQVVDGEISILMGDEPPAEGRSAPPASASSTASPTAAPRLQVSTSGGDAGPADHKRIHAALASVPLFADLDAASISRLEAFTFRRQFAAGEVIVEEGRTGNGLYVVLSGSVEVIRGLAGARPQRVAVLGPGEPFGEMALLGDWKRSASVRATDDVECMGMDRWAFLAHLKTEPNLAIRMLQMLAERLAETNARLVE